MGWRTARELRRIRKLTASAVVFAERHPLRDDLRGMPVVSSPFADVPLHEGAASVSAYALVLDPGPDRPRTPTGRGASRSCPDLLTYT